MRIRVINLLLASSLSLLVTLTTSANPRDQETQMRILGQEFARLYQRVQYDISNHYGDFKRDDWERLVQISHEVQKMAAEASSHIPKTREIEDLRQAIEQKQWVPYQTNVFTDRHALSVPAITIALFLELTLPGIIDSFFPIQDSIEVAAFLISFGTSAYALTPLRPSNPKLNWKIRLYHFPILETAQFLRKRRLKKLLGPYPQIAAATPFIEELQRSGIKIETISQCATLLSDAQADSIQTSTSLQKIR